MNGACALAPQLEQLGQSLDGAHPSVAIRLGGGRHDVLDASRAVFVELLTVLVKVVHQPIPGHAQRDGEVVRRPLVAHRRDEGPQISGAEPDGVPAVADVDRTTNCPPADAADPYRNATSRSRLHAHPLDAYGLANEVDHALVPAGAQGSDAFVGPATPFGERDTESLELFWQPSRADSHDQ